MYSFANLEPVCCSMPSSNCCFLTCIQISQEAGQVVWYSHFFQNFPQFVVIHTVNGFGVVNKAEVDVFVDSLAFSTIQQKLAIWSPIHLPFLKPAWMSGFMVHVLLKADLENFEPLLVCEMSVVVWIFFGIAFVWDWNENWPFPGQWPLLCFPNFLAYWAQHLHSIIF